MSSRVVDLKWNYAIITYINDQVVKLKGSNNKTSNALAYFGPVDNQALKHETCKLLYERAIHLNQVGDKATVETEFGK